MVIENPAAKPIRGNDPSANVDAKPASKVVSESQLLKKIRIQSGVVARLMKDHIFYVEESDRIIHQVELMKRSEMYAESKRMIPHVLTRLQAARDFLYNQVESVTSCASLKDMPPVVLEARARIEAASAILNDTPCATGAGTDDVSAESDGTDY